MKLNTETAVVHSWLNAGEMNGALAAGYRVVDSRHAAWYLDCGAGNWLGGVGASWCRPFKTWQHVYLHEPTADAAEEHHHMILGGEVALWGEQNGQTNCERDRNSL